MFRKNIARRTRNAIITGLVALGIVVGGGAMPAQAADADPTAGPVIYVVPIGTDNIYRPGDFINFQIVDDDLVDAVNVQLYKGGKLIAGSNQTNISTLGLTVYEVGFYADNLTPGTYTFVLTATDALGNTSPTYDYTLFKKNK